MTKAHILSLATAAAPHILDSTYVLEEAASIFGGRASTREKMEAIFANTGILQRQSVCPTDWFRGNQGWPERTKAFLEGAKMMFKKAAQEALDNAGLQASAIDTIVTISSTGIATPSIEAHVMTEMGFRTDVKRVPVFGLGCAGGLSGLSLAARLAKADPGTNVLLVVIELCTLAFRADDMTMSNIVATALFGDGAAAIVLRAGDGGPWAIEHAGEHTWPDTIDVMGWRVDKEGFGAIFSRSIPDLALRDLRPAADAFLSRYDMTMADIPNFTFHPGGTKVVAALETSFELPQGTLVAEREVLAAHGNMSAPTVLFVLKQAYDANARGLRFLGSLGPGFTASFMTMTNA